MSLCRFSSMDYACDLYCYYDCFTGITTHIALYRVVGDIPKMPALVDGNIDAFLAADAAQSAFLRDAERVPIGLPEDGKTFGDGTLAEFKERLHYLRGLGYRFPDSLFDVTEEPT